MPTPYLTFDGTTLEAFRFYAEVLGGKLEFSQSFGESPAKDSIPEEFRDRTMHATLNLPDGKLMAADAGPWAPFQGSMQSCALSLHFDDAAEGKRVFDALSSRGKVTMPFEKTFWADGFGMLTDRFGVAWMVNCGQNQSGGVQSESTT
jgi:PhnB protein